MKWAFIILILFIYFLFFPTKVLASSIVLNELLPHPSSANDWIELYNPTSSAVDLSNWTIVDSTSTIKTLSGIISPSGFLVFEVTNRLNNSADTIYLKDSSGITIDQYSYSQDPGIDRSYGRSPDGGSWATLSSSKGVSNPSISSPPSPTPSPNPTVGPSPSPTSSPKPNLTISNVTSSAKVDQEFNVSVSITNFKPHSTYHLKGAFKLPSGGSYFGLTKIEGGWAKNSDHYQNQYPITTDSAGSFSGSLTVKGDPLDSDFTGLGNYILKVGYYSNSPTVSWSNEVNIYLDNPSIQLTPGVPSAMPTPSPQFNTSHIRSKQYQQLQPKTTTTPSPQIIALPPALLGTTSAAWSPSPSANPVKTQVGSATLVNVFMIGSGLIIILAAILGFTFYKNGNFHNIFKKRNP